MNDAMREQHHPVAISAAQRLNFLLVALALLSYPAMHVAAAAAGTVPVCAVVGGWEHVNTRVVHRGR
jgi:hypothetical protein